MALTSLKSDPLAAILFYQGCISREEGLVLRCLPPQAAGFLLKWTLWIKTTPGTVSCTVLNSEVVSNARLLLYILLKWFTDQHTYSGLCRQVVLLYKWYLRQMWLYLLLCSTLWAETRYWNTEVASVLCILLATCRHCP